MAEKYDDKFFDNLVREGNGLGANAESVIKDEKEILEHAEKKTLKELANASPREFYTKLCLAYGSAMMNKAGDLSITRRAKEKMLSLHDYLQTKPAFFQWLYKVVTFVAKAIVGIIKFSWDVLLTAGAFTGRVGYHLVKNVGVALWDTIKETKEDAIGAGTAIKDSFKDNLMPKTCDDILKVDAEVVTA